MEYWTRFLSLMDRCGKCWFKGEKLTSSIWLSFSVRVFHVFLVTKDVTFVFRLVIYMNQVWGGDIVLLVVGGVQPDSFAAFMWFYLVMLEDSFGSTLILSGVLCYAIEVFKLCCSMGLQEDLWCWMIDLGWTISINVIICFPANALNYFILTEVLGLFYGNQLKLASSSVSGFLFGLCFSFTGSYSVVLAITSACMLDLLKGGAHIFHIQMLLWFFGLVQEIFPNCFPHCFLY